MSTVSYSFLSKPPQLKQKKRPVPVAPVNVHPIPVIAIAEQSSPHSLSATFASITLWAQAVQPGSPAPRSPPSPYKRRASVSSLRKARRRSISHSRACSTSGSFLHLIETPTTSSGHKNTPSAKDLTFDFTNLGYTSLFVPLPNTPATPSLRITSSSSTAGKDAVASTPPSPSKAKISLSLKRIRSLGVLKPLRTGRPRSKSNSSSNGPPSPARAKSKSKAAKVKKTLPPTLGNELLLLQFMDGGSLESNMKRVMAKQAKREAKNVAKSERAVGDAHRDGKGGFWRDQDEEMEYRPLLVDGDDDGWVQFEEEEPAPKSKKAPRKRPAPLKLAGAASSGFADSFAPASAPVEEKATDKQTSRWALFGGKN